MCQHVRSRCARSSEQDRQAGVGLRVPRAGVSALYSILAPDAIDECHHRAPRRRLELRDFHDRPAPECIREGEDDRQRRRRRGSRWAGEAKAVAEDSREIGKPRRNAGGVSDEHRVPALRGITSRSFVRDRWDEALGLEEAWPPESVQPGSGGRRSRTLGYRPQPCRVENGFYPSARSQGGFETAHRRESALFSWPFATSIQVCSLV